MGSFLSNMDAHYIFTLGGMVVLMIALPWALKAGLEWFRQNIWMR